MLVEILRKSPVNCPKEGLLSNVLPAPQLFLWPELSPGITSRNSARESPAFPARTSAQRSLSLHDASYALHWAREPEHMEALLSGRIPGVIPWLIDLVAFSDAGEGRHIVYEGVVRGAPRVLPVAWDSRN